MRRLGLDDAAVDGAIAAARDERRTEAARREPELADATKTVQKRREQALREGDVGMAAGLSQIERLLDTIAGESGAPDWRELIPRLRRRLGLRDAEPPAEPPASPGG